MERSRLSESARALSRVRRPEWTRPRTLSQACVARVSPGLVHQADHGRQLAGARLESTQPPAPGPDWHGLISGRLARSQAGPGQCLGERSPAVRALSNKRIAAHSLAPESTIIDDGLVSGRLSQFGPCVG